MKKRTQIDWSKHELIITEHTGLLIHHLKKPDTIVNNVKFINTNGVLVVTGDFGNWIFCMEFHPSEEGAVSDGYWIEKLKILSCQEPKEYDQEETVKRLQEMIDVGAEEYGWTGEKLEIAKRYYENCIVHSDDYWDYVVAMRDKPSFIDYEMHILCERPKMWLLTVFDAFEEVCSRIEVMHQMEGGVLV